MGPRAGLDALKKRTIYVLPSEKYKATQLTSFILQGLAVRLIKKFHVTENSLYITFCLLRIGFLNGFFQFYFSARMLYVFVLFSSFDPRILLYLISSSKQYYLKGTNYEPLVFQFSGLRCYFISLRFENFTQTFLSLFY